MNFEVLGKVVERYLECLISPVYLKKKMETEGLFIRIECYPNKRVTLALSHSLLFS